MKASGGASRPHPWRCWPPAVSPLWAQGPRETALGSCPFCCHSQPWLKGPGHLPQPLSDGKARPAAQMPHHVNLTCPWYWPLRPLEKGDLYARQGNGQAQWNKPAQPGAGRCLQALCPADQPPLLPRGGVGRGKARAVQLGRGRAQSRSAAWCARAFPSGRSREGGQRPRSPWELCPVSVRSLQRAGTVRALTPPLGAATGCSLRQPSRGRQATAGASRVSWDRLSLWFLRDTRCPHLLLRV